MGKYIKIWLIGNTISILRYIWLPVISGLTYRCRTYIKNNDIKKITGRDKLKYNLYLWLVYYWIDDDLLNGYLDSNMILDLLDSPIIKMFYIKDVKYLIKHGKPCNDTITDYKIPVGLYFILLCRNNGNNYKNKFFYKRYKDIVNGIGYKEKIIKNGIVFYRLKM